MTWALLLGCLLSAAPEARLEAALFVPPVGGVVLSSGTVLHDAERGVTILPAVAPEAVLAYLTGEAGRLVATGVGPLTADGLPLHLALGSAELTYTALRNGRPQQVQVANPAAVTVLASSARWQADGRARVRLRFEVVAYAGQTTATETAQVAGEPLFRSRRIEIEQVLVVGQPVIVILDSGAPGELAGQPVELTVRNRVGGTLIESAAPLVGVALRLLAPGGPTAYTELRPPVAPPGQVAVYGPVRRPGPRAWEPGLTAGGLIDEAGPPARPTPVEVARLDAEGNVLRRALPGPPTLGADNDFALQERDTLTLGAPLEPAGAKADTGPQRSEPLRAGGPAGPAPLGAAIERRGAEAPERASPWSRNLPVEQLKQAAPPTATATAATVALRGRVAAPTGDRELLLSGTIVTADGLILTTPAAALAHAVELRAQLPDGRQLSCERVAIDATGSLLALQVAAQDLPAPRLGPPPPPGRVVVVVGHPYGLLHSVTVTVVGGPPRELAAFPGADLQLDGALAAGNSGGPVVDLEGRLVGLAYGNLQADEPGPAISLAVSGRHLAAFLEQLKQAGRN